MFAPMGPAQRLQSSALVSPVLGPKSLILKPHGPLRVAQR